MRSCGRTALRVFGRAGSWLLLFAGVIVTTPSLASAETAKRPRAARVSKAVRADQARGWERAPGPDADDVLLFVPRALLFLPELALRTVFLPLRAAIDLAARTTAEAGVESDPEPERGATIAYPTFSHLTDFGPTLGAYAAYDNLTGHAERLELAASMFGREAPAVELGLRGDSIDGTGLWLESSVRYHDRPREIFEGIGTDGSGVPGPNADPRAARTRTRYGLDELTLRSELGQSFGGPRRRSRFGLSSRYSIARYRSDHADPDPPIDDVYDTARLAGFRDGARTLEELLHLIGDTRDRVGTPTRGVYADVFAGGSPLGNEDRFIRYGLDLTAHFDVFRGSRVVLTRVRLENIEAFGGEPAFSELPELGGPNRLRGYAPGRFRAERAVLASIEYRYPVHELLDAHLFADAGRVASRLDALLELENWRGSAGFGLRIRSSELVIFTLDVAYGDGPWVFLTTSPRGAAAEERR